MGTCVSKCKCSLASTADAGHSLCGGGSPTPNHHVQQPSHALNVHPLPLPLPADAAADYASPTPTTTTTTTTASTSTSSISMATSTISSSSSSSATCSSPVFLKARPRLQGSVLETSCSWDVVVLDPNKPLSAVTASSETSSCTPRVAVRGHPLPRNPGRSKRARPVSPLPRPAPGPLCKKPCSSPMRTGTPTSGRQHQRAEREARFLPHVGRHRHSRVMMESRKSASSRGAMAAAGVGGGELADDLNNPLISMDCFIFL